MGCHANLVGEAEDLLAKSGCRNAKTMIGAQEVTTTRSVIATSHPIIEHEPRYNWIIHRTLANEVEVRMPHICISCKNHGKVGRGTHMPRTPEQLLPKCNSLTLRQTCRGA